MSETAVTSFIIRFTQEKETEQPAIGWHGLVRHVQSDESRHFSEMDEALAFISNFVKIDTYTKIDNLKETNK